MAIFLDSQVWVTISFAVFLFILWKFAKDKLLAALDGRIASIKQEIETAESLRVEAQELLAQYQRKQRDAAEEAEQLVAAAREQAAAIEKQSEADLKEIARRREENLAARLKRMEEDAKAEIRAYAAELAVKATAEIIAAQLDKKANENLINQSIKDVAKQLG